MRQSLMHLIIVALPFFLKNSCESGSDERVVRA